MTIDLFFTVASPPARAVAVLAKHLNLDVNPKSVNVMAGETRTAEYLKINPAHTVPTLVDNGFAVFESRAILQYLANKYAPGNSIYPSEAQARANVDKILFYDASAFMPSMKAVIVPKFRNNVDPPKEAVDDLKEKMCILETLLGDNKFFAGDNVTIADISLGVSIPFMNQFEAGLSSAKFDAWYERLVKEVPTLLELNEQAMKIYKEMSEKK